MATVVDLNPSNVKSPYVTPSYRSCLRRLLLTDGKQSELISFQFQTDSSCCQLTKIDSQMSPVYILLADTYVQKQSLFESVSCQQPAVRRIRKLRSVFFPRTSSVRGLYIEIHPKKKHIIVETLLEKQLTLCFIFMQIYMSESPEITRQYKNSLKEHKEKVNYPGLIAQVLRVKCFLGGRGFGDILHY